MGRQTDMRSVWWLDAAKNKKIGHPVIQETCPAQTDRFIVNPMGFHAVAAANRKGFLK